MSTALIFLVDHAKAGICAHTRLAADSAFYLFDELYEIRNEYGRDLPRDYSSYVSTRRNGEHCYGRIRNDAYGEPLKRVYAERLKPLGKKIRKEDYESRAVWAYLCALPDDVEVILYWH